MKTNMAASMLNSPTLGPSSLPPPPSRLSTHNRLCPTITPKTRISLTNSNPSSSNKSIIFPIISCCFNSSTTEASTTTSSPDEASTPPKELPPVKKKRRASYRRMRPGEAQGITEEMRFVAMKLRSKKPKIKSEKGDENGEIEGCDDDGISNENEDEDQEMWEPEVDGFVKYLVDSKFVFSTIERLVGESQDVSFAYFRNTGLERSESFTKDLEWFSQQNVTIPEPQIPSKKYVEYLEELAVRRPPLFFCHLYNIYFSHIAGGQVISRKVSEKLSKGRELEICRWPGDPELLLKGVREKLNALGQHWSRDEKNKCLKEANKSFMHLGAIIRLIMMP